jgi:DeoR/GlpR family transcriptional regulator of sugar metabolism
MAKLLDVTMRTIMRDIETLRDKGKLKRIGGRKDGYWKVIDENEK